MGWGWGEAQPFVRGRGAGLETPVSAVGASKAQEAPNRSKVASIPAPLPLTHYVFSITCSLAFPWGKKISGLGAACL